MNSPRPERTPPALMLVDDGWRVEKVDILRFLKQAWTFDVATHDPVSHEKLREYLDARLLPRYPLRRGLRYTLVMFFARSLDTNLVRYRERMKFLTRPAHVRFLFKVRSMAARLRIRCYRYASALAFLYRGSDKYRDVLKPYSMVVYNPVTVRDKRILFEAKAAGLRLVSWVFSWDNPMKDNEFLVDADHYLVWNEENRRDLVRYHAIPADRIHIVGPSQFDVYLEMRKLPRPTDPEPYILYACAVGLDQHLDQEIRMILKIREIMDRLDPALPLWVRPYPFRLDRTFGYDALRNRPGIKLLDFGELKDNRIMVNRGELEQKWHQIRNARGLINFGSTLGLEASFTDTPIVQIGFSLPFDGPAYLDVAELFKNEHLQYILDDRFPNTVRDLEQLERALGDLVGGRVEPYRAYTEHLQRFAHPLDTSCYRAVLLDTLQRLELANDLEEGAGD